MVSKRVVVTGATGNIGSSVVSRLLAEGHAVTGVSRRRPPEGVRPWSAMSWRCVDLARDDDLPELRAALRGADAVVHLAWGFQPSHRPDYLEELGVGGTRRVAEAVVAQGVPQLVHMSSVGAYSRRTGDTPVGEDHPTDGVPSSPYSRHKAAAERLLDLVEAEHPELVVTRLRPGIVGKGTAGSSLLRYAVPGVVPARLLRLVPLLPLDRRLQVPVVHSDDVAQAVALALERPAVGAFNLASDPPVTVELLGRSLGARPVHVPAEVLRRAVAGLWHVRAEQLDPGWVDLAYAVPLLDTARARAELGWVPEHTGVEVLAEVLEGLMAARSGPSPVLRPRTVLGNLGRAARRGPVHRRLLP